MVVVGDLYVGKTSLIHRLCKNVFDRDYKATIGVDFEIERFEIAGIPYSLQIWDTAGQEKFKCIASAYYRGAQGEQPNGTGTLNPCHLREYYFSVLQEPLGWPRSQRLAMKKTPGTLEPWLSMTVTPLGRLPQWPVYSSDESILV